MSVLQTNRDLYLAIEGLVKQNLASSRSLEEYLRAMLAESDLDRDTDGLSLDRFQALLEASFTSPPAEFNEKWREQYDDLLDDLSNYLGWRATLIQQIVDLREMEESGTLGDEYRYFGVSSPRNSYWYNFDATSYLECAMAGSFGGWELRDDTDRDFAPGPVATLADDGKIEMQGPKEIPRPVFKLLFVTWEHFVEFLRCGQMYE